MFSLPLNPLSFLEIASLLYLGIRAHKWPRKSEFLILTFGKEEFATLRQRKLRHNVPEATGICLTGSLWHKAFTLLRRATQHSGVPRSCVPEDSAAPLCVFFASGLFFYYSASFFTPISLCPIKHYSMGD